MNKGYNNLKNFAIEAVGESECILGIDDFQLREMALKHGLIERKIMLEPCSEDCYCKACECVFPCECYKKTELLKDSSDE